MSGVENMDRFLQDRFISSEKATIELCNAFSEYSKKVAKLRNEGDVLSGVVLKYAENEKHNKSMSAGLKSISGGLGTLGDYEDLRVQLIDEKVVSEFSKYDNIFKELKEELKVISHAVAKETSKKVQLEQLKSKNIKNPQQIVEAEAELVRSTSEAAKAVCYIGDKVTRFESQKLHDIKELLLDFLTIEIGYHSKALKILTQVYQHTYEINPQSDLKDLKSTLYTKINILKKHQNKTIGAEINQQ